MKLVYTTLLFLLAGLSIHAQITTWNTIQKPAYSIQCPGNWSVDSSKQFGSELFFNAPIDSIGDKFRENVSVMVQNIAGKDVSMERFVAVSENQIRAMAPELVILEDTTISTAPVTYHKMHFTCKQGQFALEIEQFYFVTATRAYVITFTSEQKKFNQYQVTGEKILASFRLK